jgi:hypothetical protein
MRISKKKLKKLKITPRGPGGGDRILFFFQNFYYFFSGAHAKIGNPTTTPSVDLKSGGPKKRRTRKD